MSELWAYLRVDTVSHMSINAIHEDRETTLFLHATFPFVMCSEIQVEIENLRGGKGATIQGTPTIEARAPNREELKILRRINSLRNIKANQGSCTLKGEITIARVGGMLHLKIYNFERAGDRTLDHYIHDLSFGPPIPDVTNPLKEVYVDAPQDTARVAYTLKAIPTSITTRYGRTTRSFQYSALSEYETISALATIKDKRHGPGVHFAYDFSPVGVVRREKSTGFFQFFTSSCAIIGGVFTTSGLLVGFIQNVRRTAKKD